MDRYKFTFVILVIFLKTGNVLSENNIFNVNNIELTKKTIISNDDLANQAIKKAFKELTHKILLKEEVKVLSDLTLIDIKDLVKYYQVLTNENYEDIDKIKFNVSFDRDKLHALFYKKGISYSEIINKELYLLPVIRKKDKIYIFNNNFFYTNWNDITRDDLIEFILPVENIEVIQTFSLNKDNLIDINLDNLFKEYSNKNVCLVLIEEKNLDKKKIFLKSRILGKNIDKNIIVERENLDLNQFNEKIIFEISETIINLIKSQNLIDVRIPSFLNTKLVLKNENDFVELNRRLAKIDLIDNLFVQEFNNEYILIKIKYLGKLEKIINQLKDQKIILNFVNEQWNIKIL